LDQRYCDVYVYPTQKQAVERVAGVLFSDVLNSDPGSTPGGQVN